MTGNDGAEKCGGCGGYGYWHIAGFEDRNRPIPCTHCGMSGRVPAGAETKTQETAA